MYIPQDQARLALVILSNVDCKSSVAVSLKLVEVLPNSRVARSLLLSWRGRFVRRISSRQFKTFLFLYKFCRLI